MDIKTYIESGILELYVAGALSEKENEEVYALMLQHPEILQEVLEIEAAIIKLTSATSRGNNNHILQNIKQVLNFNNKDTKVISIAKPKYNWVTYTGWAASIILAAGVFWTVNQNNKLQSEIQVAETKQLLLETQIANSKNSLEEANTLITVLRDDNITRIPLAGQGSFANTYAKVYWDKTAQRIFIDGAGLPEPPEGKVYQVWSLTLNPLTPTSLGTIDDFKTDANKIFEIKNVNQSEAFGITLEPAGGSETPTMEQLYTLGVV
ncbi:anti-sigma factor domain-containing protein [Thalassobellus suaedae]|uniref:Anti-sigma factor n=1 Tax=Thalassobellus suaedae TaxID=3074124 RepID=A0ABY9XPY5_9FLAO|nr:anti-sigma factor [Flavobacteriaceae bacterium HL-DH14]WNH13250.1 anti-sigma factor [Flavobacteriaceae bacterium HL-DH10]